MQSKTAQFASTVASNDLVVANRVTVAFSDAPQFADVTLACEAIAVQRDMTTDAPEGTRLVSGYPTSTATLALSGLIDPWDTATAAADLLNPYNSASPIYRSYMIGTPVTVEAGLWLGDVEPEYATVFTGFIDSYTVDPVSGVVTVECIDGRAALRSVPDFRNPVADPMPAITTTSAGTTYSGQNVRPGLTSVYVIDALLRANGIYAALPARPGALLFASMAGSAYPTVYNRASYPTWADQKLGVPGQYRDFSDVGDPMTFVPGYWTDQVPAACDIFAAISPTDPVTQPRIAMGTGGGWYWQAMVNFTDVITYADGSTMPASIDASLQVNTGVGAATSWDGGWNLSAYFTPAGVPDGNHTFTFTGGNATASLTVGPGWHQLGVQMTFTSGTVATYTIYVDGSKVATATGTLYNALPAGSPTATRTHVSTYMPLECLCITGETAATPDSVAQFQPGAVLDASLNNLHATIDVTGKDPWNVIQDLAAAELAVAGFDELGVFRFTNRDTLRRTPSVRQLRSDASVKGLGGFQQSSANVANRVVVPVNGVAIGSFQAIYQGPDDSSAFTLRGQSKYTTSVQTLTPFVGASPFCYLGNYPPLQADGVHPAANNFASGFRASSSKDGKSAAVTTGLAMTVAQSAPDVVKFTIQNTNAFAVYLLTPQSGITGVPAGDLAKPFFFIGGFPIYYGSTDATDSDVPTVNTGTGNSTPTGTSTPAANAQYVRGGQPEQALQISANDWIQDLDTAQQLADDVLEDLLYPRPIWPAVALVADPRLQIADRLTLTDPDASSVNDDAVLFGLSLQISATAWDQSLDLRAIGQPGYWVLGAAGRTELGATAYV